jgi:hypothetical protein
MSRLPFLRLAAVCATLAGPAFATPAALASAAPSPTIAPAAPAPATGCTLEYQRADNMWSAAGRPDGGLGAESLALPTGLTKLFDTDWKYEKLRNDGTTYYGSHLRVARNRGTVGLRLRVRLNQYMTEQVVLAPGASRDFRADLMEVSCLQPGQ